MKLLKDAVFVVSTWKCVNLSLYVYHKRLFHNVHIFSYIIKMLQPWQTRIYNATIKIKRICSYQRSKIRLSVRPGQPKMSPDNQKYWCGCPTDNHKFSCPSCETRPHLPCSKYGQPKTWTDNQKLSLVVRGTTIYFSLIRTLLTTKKYYLFVYWFSKSVSPKVITEYVIDISKHINSENTNALEYCCAW